MASVPTVKNGECRTAGIVLPRRSCWPDEWESLLLQAGLCAKPKALQCWTDFCGRIGNIENLDESCYRLFPLVAGNLQSCDAVMPHRDRLRGVFRHAWAKNQKLFMDSIPLLQALRGGGVDLLLLKGAALAGLYRDQGGVRPMADIDILIHPEDVPQALGILQALGCTADKTVTTARLMELLRYRHELTLRSASGAELDIHWHLVSDSRHLEIEDCFWQDAVPCRLENFSAYTLNPAQQLLHCCLHGAQWNEIPPVRWLADAVMIIRSGVDWNRLENQARSLERIEPVRDTLLFLDRLDVELPPGIVARWRDMPVTMLEKMEGGYRAYRPDSRQRTRQLAWSYLRWYRGRPLSEMLGHIPGYMRQIHHFRAYSRRMAFLWHLLLLFLKPNTLHRGTS